MSNWRESKLKHMMLTTAVVFFVVNFWRQMTYEYGLLIFAGLISVLAGSFFIIRVIHKDIDDVFTSLDAQDTMQRFIEFKPLYDAYDKKCEALAKLKAKGASEQKHLEAIKRKTVQSKLTLKNSSEDRQKLELSKDNTEAFFRNLSERLSSMIWLTDYNGRVIYANQQLLTKINRVKDQSITIYDILNIDKRQFDLFRSKDFARISLEFNEGFSVPGRSQRLFDNQSIKYLLFMSDTSNHDKIMTKTYLKKSRDLHFISEVSKIISGQVSIESTLQDAIDKITLLGNFNACGIRLLNDEQMLVLKAKSGYALSLLLPDQVKTINTHIGYAVNESKIVTLNNVGDMLFEEQEVKEILLQNKKMVFIPLTNYNHNLGVMTIVSDEDIDSENVVLLESVSISVTIALEKILLYDKLKSDYFKTVEAFVTASELKSKTFGGHSRRVAEISKKIAELLFLSSNEVDDIYITGLLHDVGKLITAESSEKHLSEYDYGIIGRKIIEKVGFKKDVLDGVEYHHLNFDLSNLKGAKMTQQPYYAQIIRIVSDFDMRVIMNPNGIANLEDLSHFKSESGLLYAPQFVKVLEHILVNEMEWLKRLYWVEVDNV